MPYTTAERKKEWRRRNADRLNRRRRERSLTPEQREHARQRKERWALANPGRYQEQRQKDRAIEKEKRRIEAGFYERQARLAERRQQRDLIREERAALARERSLLPWNDLGLPVAEYYRLRYSLDVEFNLRERIKTAMCKRRHGQRVNVRLRTSTKPDELTVSYSLSELQNYIGGRFVNGMTWGAYLDGRVEIDHVVPFSHFDLSDEAQLMQAWALDNLQPLWAEDNKDKRNRTMSEWLATLPSSHPMRQAAALPFPSL